LSRENGVWWIGAGENRRKDDEVDAQEEEAREKVDARQDFDWEELLLMRLRCIGNPDRDDRVL
ncbi:hypothetical protein Dimus_037145, partial [Dionaea muscipula]